MTENKNRDCLFLDEAFVDNCSKCSLNDVCDKIDSNLEKIIK